MPQGTTTKMCRCNSDAQNVLGEMREIPGTWHDLGCPMHAHYDEQDYLSCTKCNRFVDGADYEPVPPPYLRAMHGHDPDCPVCGRAPGTGPRGFMGAPAPRAAMGQAAVAMPAPTAGALVGVATLGVMLLLTAG